MENYYLLFMGILVFLLHIPGLIIPKRHRELGRHFVQQSLNMRLIGLIMVLIGVGAFLVSPSQAGIKWFLMAFGIYQSLSGFALIFFPNAFASKTERKYVVFRVYQALDWPRYRKMHDWPGACSLGRYEYYKMMRS